MSSPLSEAEAVRFKPMLTDHPDSVLKAVDIASGAEQPAAGRSFTAAGAIADG
ncbi:MAG: hypothetical protein HKO85_02785 [Xanthomonadales bacterium]|nr:hypothetical protein [Xanthomonadales bacterium]